MSSHTYRWQPPPAARGRLVCWSLTERRWQPPAGRAGLCAVAAAGREGLLVCRSHAPPVGGRLTERAVSRRPGGPACVPWQPPAGRAGLCADLMRRLLAGALQRELATAGREGRLVCRGNRRPGGAGLCADLVRRLLAGALRERKPCAPPAGGRRGQIESLAHAYATCAVMSRLDSIQYSVMFDHGNGVIHRGRKPASRG